MAFCATKTQISNYDLVKFLYVKIINSKEINSINDVPSPDLLVASYA